ncbi:MAG: hypothetical protein H7Y06_02630, partial [Opitutaceae bacterium]|nr:hypothetical protein [Opitutaceae bacterium]
MSSSNPSVRLTVLEKITLVHVAVLLLGSTWAFGGNIGWARLALSLWGSLALPITAFALLNKGSLAPGVSRRQAWWLLPAALYAVLVLASAFNPSFQAF